MLRVARGGNLRLVSPYIGVGYFERMLGVGNGEWRLLSDVHEWLSALSVRARPRAWSFLRDNLSRIHHCPSIHAKAVISDHLAMFGSANLTTTGILGRTELGILIEDPKLVAELHDWFDALWHDTAPPTVDEANALVQWLDEEAAKAPIRRPRFALAGLKQARAHFAALPGRPVGQSAPASPTAPMDLTKLAESLATESQRHYESLGQALEDALDALTMRGPFHLKDVVNVVGRSFSGGTVREVYMLVLQHCANHVRSAFATNTVNRLILTGDQFEQSSPEALPAALAPFDAFLRYVIEHLDFNESRQLEGEVVMQAATGFSGQDQVVLVAELLDCGMLELDDIPGELPHYLLDETYEWGGRFRLFHEAWRAWQIAKHRPSKITATELDEDDDLDDDTHSAGVTAILARDADDPGDAPDWRMINRELKAGRAKLEAAKAQQASELERQCSAPVIDQAMARLLSHLLKGEDFVAKNAKRLNMQLESALQAEPATVRTMLTNSTVFRIQRTTDNRHTVAINPTLNWQALESYPLTKSVCQEFLSA